MFSKISTSDITVPPNYVSSSSGPTDARFLRDVFRKSTREQFFFFRSNKNVATYGQLRSGLLVFFLKCEGNPVPTSVRTDETSRVCFRSSRQKRRVPYFIRVIQSVLDYCVVALLDVIVAHYFRAEVGIGMTPILEVSRLGS